MSKGECGDFWLRLRQCPNSVQPSASITILNIMMSWKMTVACGFISRSTEPSLCFCDMCRILSIEIHLYPVSYPPSPCCPPSHPQTSTLVKIPCLEEGWGGEGVTCCALPRVRHVRAPWTMTRTCRERGVAKRWRSCGDPLDKKLRAAGEYCHSVTVKVVVVAVAAVSAPLQWYLRT